MRVPQTHTMKKATTNNKWVKTWLDGLGRVIKTEAGHGASTTVSIVDTEYDSCACSPVGKVKRVSQPHAPGGTVYWTTYTYDGLGRTTSIAHPGGDGTTTYLYEGETVKWTDPAGKWKKYTSDALGNLVTVNEPRPGGGADYVTSYTYNLHNQLTQVSMPRPTGTQTRTLTYDLPTGRLMSAQNPENGTVSYTYNSDGTMATKTDANGNRFEFSYDAYKRVTQSRRIVHDAYSQFMEDICQRVDYYYDTNPLDGSFTQNGWGRLTAVAWKGGRNSNMLGVSPCTVGVGTSFAEMYSYGSSGLPVKNRLRMYRPLYEWQQPQTADLEASYTYDGEGKMLSMKYPDAWNQDNQLVTGATYTYSFDSMGRPNKLVDNKGTPDWIKDVLYGPAGQLTQISWLRQVDYITNQYHDWGVETRNYNARVQMTSRTVNIGFLQTTQYVYSPTANNGRITQMIGGGETVNYSYDTLNRLTLAETAGPQWGLTFTYDGFGNRESQAVTKGSAPTSYLSYSATTNRVVGWWYDGNGNALQGPLGPNVGLGYDADNRLSIVANEYYAYTPANLRHWVKKADGTEEVRFYGVTGQRLGVYGVGFYLSTLRFSKSYTSVYFGGRPVGGVNLLDQFAGGGYPDRLGSNGPHYPYGEPKGLPPPVEGELFATYYRDGSTGLDYARNRYYAPTAGRFLTADPYMASGGAANPGSWNRYAYVEGDPINFVDPPGLFRCHSDQGHVCFSTTVTTSSDTSGGGNGGSTGGGGIGSGDGMEVVEDGPLGGDGGGGSGGGGPSSPTDVNAEPCTFAMMLGMECDNKPPGLGAGILSRLGARFAGLGSVGWWLGARITGGAGERIVGNILNLNKNTRQLENTASGINRIPDFWDFANKVIVEVKNVSELSYTAQIRDMVIWADTAGYTFQLWVNNMTELSPAVQALVNTGKINLQRFSWP